MRWAGQCLQWEALSLSMGGLKEFRDAHKKKKGTFFYLFCFGAAHLIWYGTYPIRDKKNRGELSWQGPYSHHVPCRGCVPTDWAGVVEGSMLWAYYHLMKWRRFPFSRRRQWEATLWRGLYGEEGARLGRSPGQGSCGEALKDPPKTPPTTSTAPEGCSRGHQWQTLVS